MAIARYGYKDGSGEYFIILNTDKCNGCGKCAEACPYGVLVMGEDPTDPLRDEPVPVVADEHKKKIKYSCAPCKPVGVEKPTLPCVKACPNDALSHSW
ncbi:ferredoxin [Candidatus Micrarchaeota archaeon]|nr:MAG: ferredoxin [Candidatus Micrarchaeota archaeon]